MTSKKVLIYFIDLNGLANAQVLDLGWRADTLLVATAADADPHRVRQLRAAGCEVLCLPPERMLTELLRELGAPKRLGVLIEGESLFNDGVAVVVFLVLLGIARGGTEVSAGAVAWLFVQEAVGGALSLAPAAALAPQSLPPRSRGEAAGTGRRTRRRGLAGGA